MDQLGPIYFTSYTRAITEHLVPKPNLVAVPGVASAHVTVHGDYLHTVFFFFFFFFYALVNSTGLHTCVCMHGQWIQRPAALARVLFFFHSCSPDWPIHTITSAMITHPWTLRAT